LEGLTGSLTFLVTNHEHAFHHLALLIYYLMKVKEGKIQCGMAKTTTQGNKICMGDGFNYMVKYLDEIIITQ
jgi:hypothetical protein